MNRVHKVTAVVLMNTVCFGPLAYGGEVVPNQDTFVPFSLPEIVSGMRGGIVGRFPDMPPSEAIGSGAWDAGEDALFTVDYGNQKMRIFHTQDSSFYSSSDNVAFIFMPENLIMDGDTIVGLNTEAWYDSISSHSLVVAYKSVAMDSYDQDSPPSDVITSTRAVWFQAPSGLWVAATKSRYTLLVNSGTGMEIDIVYTELIPNYYLQTERDAEVVARMVLGDFEFCVEEFGTQKSISECTPFVFVPQDMGPSLIDVDPPLHFDPTDAQAEDCSGDLNRDLIIPKSTRSGAISDCKATHSLEVGGVIGLAVACCVGGNTVCPPHGCAIAGFACGASALAGISGQLYYCVQAARNRYIGDALPAYLSYQDCCIRNGCDAMPFGQ